MNLQSDVIYKAFTVRHTINGKTDYIGPSIECYLRHSEYVSQYLCSREFTSDHKHKKITLGQVLKIYLGYQAFKVFQEEVKASNFEMHHSNYISIRKKSPQITRLHAWRVCYNDIGHFTDHQINFIRQAFNYSAKNIRIIPQVPYFPPKIIKKKENEIKTSQPMSK